MKTTLTNLILSFGLLLAQVQANDLKFQAELSHPLIPAGEKQTAYLKVSVTGGAAPEQNHRAPINVSIVLDQSSSMSGQKIANAREAAKMAVARLQSNDTVSIVTYDSNVNVLVPSTKLTNKQAVFAAIDTIISNGSTALFAGVSKGAEELRKFKQLDAVNRIILLSDGQANIGPQTPQELGDLGAALSREGISVTTIGLGNGYNEDLMNQLALRSDGNHSFVETPGELAQVFNQELGDLLSVVAQELTLTIKLAEGVRPVRSLGRETDINGQAVSLRLNQLYAEQEKFLLLEVETPVREANQDQLIADATLSFRSVDSEKTVTATTRSVARVTADKTQIEQSLNKSVMIAAVDFIANERNLAATKLRDQGKIQEAKDAFIGNSRFLEVQAATLDSEELAKEADFNRDDALKVDSPEWSIKRKSIQQRANSKVSQNKGYRSKD
ncbi:MAG: VWA domain-containing protein [Verrucomicrobiota bacterium]